MSPSPGDYKIKSDFEKVTTKKRNSNSFGVGRNAFAKAFITLSGINAEPNLPGPGAYSSRDSGSIFSKTNTRNFSFGVKTKVYDQFEASRKMNVPGPG